MDNAQKTQLDAKSFDQIWSSSDLNPDVIRNDLNKIFTYNKTATDYANSSDLFFNYDQKEAQASDSRGKMQIGWKGFGGSAEAAHSQSSSSENSQTTHDIVSQKDIRDFLAQQNIETQWSGEKWEPKSFSVYKLTDITDQLQVALVAKQLIAEKSNGAEIKIVNLMSVPTLDKIEVDTTTTSTTTSTMSPTTTTSATPAPTTMTTTLHPVWPGLVDGVYKRFEWDYCKVHRAIDIILFDITPMPWNAPDVGHLRFIADVKRPL
ncbi:unnamed protein product, partial [Rotaria sordida]